jgi:formylglycine-generating enzyme required for sulfatase activity
MNAALLVLSLLSAPPEGDELKLWKTFREEFIAITPGMGPYPAEFVVGADAAAGKPGAKITFARAFSIAKYEVPQNLWQAAMGSNPSLWKGPRNSVEMLSYDEAVKFCTVATQRMREAGLITPMQEVRLPSEAEWEYCARAGTTTKYSFGDDVNAINEYAWHTGNAKGNDPPVGAKKPNPWGLYDVHGYLWEWTSDVWGDDAATLPADGSPRTQGDAKFGVLRSGSWKDTADRLTSGFRVRVERTIRNDAVGLRCVLTQ